MWRDGRARRRPGRPTSTRARSSSRHCCTTNRLARIASGQQRQRRWDRIGEEACALTAAEHQQRERPFACGCQIALRGPLDHLIAHRVAGETRAGERRTLEELGGLEGGGDGAHALCQHAVGSPQHGILLVHRRRNAPQRGRKQRRKGRIAAEAHHSSRPHLAQQPEGRGNAAHQHPRRAGGRDRRATGDRGGWDAIDRARGKVRAVPVAAHVGHEIDGNGAPAELLRQGEGREQVAAGAAGRKHHRPCRRTQPSSASLSQIAGLDTNPGFLTCSGSGRRRVTASSMPIVRPTASMEEPPLEMKGKRDALGRDQPDVDRHVDDGLQHERAGQGPPPPAERTSSARSTWRENTRTATSPNSPTMHEAGEHAVFLGDHGENEVGVGVGQHGLDGALARALAEEAALDEGLQRPVGLEAVADGRVPGSDRRASARSRGSCRLPAARRREPGSHATSNQRSGRPASKNSAHHTRLTSSIWPTSGCSTSRPANTR